MAREQSVLSEIIGEDEYEELADELELGVHNQEGQAYTSEQYEQLMAAERVNVYITDPHDPEAEAMPIIYQGMFFTVNCGEWVALPQPLAALLEDNQRGVRIAGKKRRALIKSMDMRRAKNWRG